MMLICDSVHEGFTPALRDLRGVREFSRKSFIKSQETCLLIINRYSEGQRNGFLDESGLVIGGFIPLLVQCHSHSLYTHLLKKEPLRQHV